MHDDLIEFIIVFGVALADIITGLIKAYVLYGKPDSQKMRIGGLHKLSELVVMAVAIGLKFGFSRISNFGGETQLAQIAGDFTVGGVFGYILVMELISILENYAAINPDAAWAQKYLSKLKKDSVNNKKGENNDDND